MKVNISLSKVYISYSPFLLVQVRVSVSLEIISTFFIGLPFSSLTVPLLKTESLKLLVLKRPMPIETIGFSGMELFSDFGLFEKSVRGSNIEAAKGAKLCPDFRSNFTSRFNCDFFTRPQVFLFAVRIFTNSSSVFEVKSITSLVQTLQNFPFSVAVILAQSSWQGSGILIMIDFFMI